jgi:hypothetical protein
MQIAKLFFALISGQSSVVESVEMLDDLIGVNASVLNCHGFSSISPNRNKSGFQALVGADLTLRRSFKMD